MQRSEITEIFPEATKEQLDALMSLHGNGINKARAEADGLTTQLKEAQEALAAATASNKSAELQEALNKLESLQAELDGMKTADSLRQTREKVAKAKGIPAELLTADTEEGCTAQADTILAFANKPGRLSLPDGGEPAAKGGPSTRDQFASWAKDNF